ncbi:hypothetical protein MJN76_29935, partial [Salmonella enterica subsp. enterica serovar Anatum]|nr:hypothetical protein [Salmonella enterica subsp. enterica serovar Anatum]
QGRELRYPKTMLTPGHQIFDPEEQLYLSRLHDGRYVLHYTDRIPVVEKHGRQHLPVSGAG